MLLVSSKLTRNFPVDRLVVNVCTYFICTVVLLSVALLHRTNQKRSQVFSNSGEINIFERPDESRSRPEHTENFGVLTEEEMNLMDIRMEKRRNRVTKSCKDLGLFGNFTRVNAGEFFVDEKNHLIWCNIFKAASTTWLYNFNRLRGTLADKYDGPDLTLHSRVRLKYPRLSVDELLSARTDRGSTAFLIVRHPFERLSSAYRDKIQNCPPAGIYADLAEEIVMKYRKETAKSEEGFFYPLWPSFEEFVRYILDRARDDAVLDIHWTPYTSFCTPCQFRFDIIVKFETFEEDQNYLVQKAGLGGSLQPHWKNAGPEKATVSNGKSTTELLVSHYSLLTDDLLTQLYEIYKLDFLIFNYTIEDYFTISSENNHGRLPAI